MTIVRSTAHEPARIERTFSEAHRRAPVRDPLWSPLPRSCDRLRRSRRKRGWAVKDTVERRNDLLVENRYVGYTVYDHAGEKIGKVDEVFVDDNDRTQYIGVKIDSLEPRSTLIPVDVTRVNERRRLVEVAASKEGLEDALTLDDGSETIPAFEQQVRSFFGVTNDGALEVPPASWIVPFL